MCLLYTLQFLLYHFLLRIKSDCSWNTVTRSGRNNTRWLEYACCTVLQYVTNYVTELLLRYIYRLKKMEIKPLKRFLSYTSTDFVTIS
jgi:hypothetical protein